MGSRISVRVRALGLVLASLAIFASAVPVLGQDASPALPPGGPDTSVHYVGATSDPNIYVAVVDRGSYVSIYLCDGADLGVWLEGPAADGGFDLTNADGAVVTGTIADGTATGSATLPDGTKLTFSADQATLPAGLYTRAGVENGEPVAARTIVLPDGSSKGKKRKYNCQLARDAYGDMQSLWITTDESDDARYIYLDISLQIRDEAHAAGCGWAA